MRRLFDKITQDKRKGKATTPPAGSVSVSSNSTSNPTPGTPQSSATPSSSPLGSAPVRPTPQATVFTPSRFVLPVRPAQGPEDLCRAASDGDIQAVESLLDAGIPVASPNARGFTPLHLAVQQGHEDVVICLLSRGASVSALGPGNLQPLHLAVAAHDARLTRLLISRGAELESAPTGATPFHLAVSSGCKEVLDALLKLGANPHATISGAAGTGETAVHMAVAAWKDEVLPQLIAAGLDVNAAGTNPPGQTPLHIAAWYGYESAARILLDAGANVNARYEDGMTALHMAAKYDQVSLCELLLEHGADITAATSHGDTALCTAATYGKKRAAEFLVDRSFHLLKPQQKGRVLILGAGGGWVDVVELLLEKGFEVNQPEVQGITALDVAAIYSHENVIVYLMKNGANPDFFAGHPRHSAQLAGATNRERIVAILTGAIPLSSVENPRPAPGSLASKTIGSTGIDPISLAWSMSLTETLTSRRRIMANPTPGGFPAQCSVCQDLDFRRGVPKDAEVIHWVLQGNVAEAAARGCSGCIVILQVLQKLAELHGESLASWKTGTEPTQLLSMVHGGPLYVSSGKGTLGSQSTVRAEIFSNPENPIAWPVVGTARDVPSGPWSDHRMKTVRGLLETCVNTHKTCNYKEGILPTRVIDVGSDTQSPFLYITNQETGRYVTLSHCWGGSSPITTTLATIEERTMGIMVDTLPKTFHDAVLITRSLGVRYMWIDSLCIIQDSWEDWEREALNMSAIYENGYVMIAAEGSDNCHGGCFPFQGGKEAKTFTTAVSGPGGRSSKVYFRLTNLLSDNRGEICHRLHSPQGGFQPNALDTRGWTLQERILAPRTLHFGKTEVGWECARGRACECQTVQTQTDTDSRFKARLIHHNGGPAAPGGTLAQDFVGERWIWSNIVDEFTHRNLTQPKDLLPALSGLAKRMSNTAENDYVCGMWRDRLPAFLFWKPDYSHIKAHDIHNAPRRHQDGYYAPTWSWASVISPVIFVGLQDQVPMGAGSGNIWKRPYPISKGEKSWDGQKGPSLLKVVDVNTVKSGLNPFGPVQDAFLTVHGFVAEARLEGKEKDLPQQGSSNGGLLIGSKHGPNAPHADFEPDVPDEEAEASIGDQLYLLYLQETETSEEGMRNLPNGKLEGLSRIASGSGLVLKAVAGGDGTYTRVGTFRFQGAANWESWRAERAERTMTLV